MTQEAELARRAAARLERTGWWQGYYGPSVGPNCLVGAIDLEAPLGDVWVITRSRVMRTLVEVILEQYPESGLSGYNGESLVTWANDSMLTSGDEAIALLEKAAVRLEEEA